MKALNYVATCMTAGITDLIEISDYNSSDDDNMPPQGSNIQWL